MIKYVTFTIHNDEPLRISDNSTSTMGETETLTYIPGSSIRGIIINKLARTGELDSEKKTMLSGQVRFMNAFITVEKDGDPIPLIPSPKGLYEDKKIQKGKKEIYNLLTQGNDMPSGMKRASMGEYSEIKGDTVFHYNLEKGSDLKVSVNPKTSEKDSLFRNEYIEPGYDFRGCVAVPDDKIAALVENSLDEVIYVGNARSSGYGKCTVSDIKCTEYLPYDRYSEHKDTEGRCYMMLLSNTVMRSDSGELCGLDLEYLERMLGVTNLRVDLCSTSTVDVMGYNRTLGIHMPMMKMYQYGSIFKLTFDGVMSADNMKTVMDEGVGLRRNEGFGQVLFLENYEDVKYKAKGDAELSAYQKIKKPVHKDDQAVLKQIAKRCFVNRINDGIDTVSMYHPFSKQDVSRSQMGVIENTARQYMYRSSEGADKIRELIDHAVEKNSKKNKGNSLAYAKKQIVDDILNASPSMLIKTLGIDEDTVMGVKIRDMFGPDEEYRAAMDTIRLRLIAEKIRMAGKERK